MCRIVSDINCSIKSEFLRSNNMISSLLSLRSFEGRADPTRVLAKISSINLVIPFGSLSLVDDDLKDLRPDGVEFVWKAITLTYQDPCPCITAEITTEDTSPFYNYKYRGRNDFKG